jgi:hypothetical protein
MLLSVLKTKLQTVTGTSIGEVFFDWKQYLNETRSKTYPCVLWQMDGMKFSTDSRTATIQKTKTFTITVYAIATFDINSQDKITVWDTLEGYFEAYLNKMNETTGITIENIDKIKGQYAGGGIISADSEIGIIYEIVLKTWC